MLNISIVSNTASSFKFTIGTQITFAKAKLLLSVSGSEDQEIDVFDATSGVSENSVVRVDTGTGQITVDLNRLPFDSIYYKNFNMQFFDVNDIFVDTTNTFQISPKGIEALYGIVNKLTVEFNQLARFSGTTVRVLTQSLTAAKCEECWDEELGQPISSTCTCSDAEFNKTDILCKKIKTQSKQEFNNSGSKIREQAVFQTYARTDFVKGTIFADLSDKQFYEVSDRTIANIGSVRTSTMFIGILIKPNDARVSKMLNLID